MEWLEIINKDERTKDGIIQNKSDRCAGVKREGGRGRPEARKTGRPEVAQDQDSPSREFGRMIRVGVKYGTIPTGGAPLRTSMPYGLGGCYTHLHSGS